MANLLAWGGQRLKGIEAQINPFDNNATYNTVLQNKFIPPAPSVKQQLQKKERVVTQRVQNYATHPFAGTKWDINNSVLGNLPKVAAAFITQNEQAKTNALDKLRKSLSDVSKTASSPNTILSFTGEGGPKGGLKTPDLPIKTTVKGSAKSSLTTKVKQQNVGPQVQSKVSTQYNVRNTADLQKSAEQMANKQGLNKTIKQAHESLDKPLGTIDDATVARVQQAIERADSAGRTHDAVNLHNSLAEHLTKQGQTIQASSLLYKLSPRGLLYKGIKDLKKGGADVTKQLEERLSGQANKIKNAKDPASKERAIAEFHKTVADNMPKSAAQSAISVWKAGLLSGSKTQGGNLFSNLTFGTLKGASNPLAAGIDKTLSLATGQRTKTFTPRGIGSGAKQGVQSGIDTLRTGIDSRNIGGGKYEVYGELNFKNKVIQNVIGKPANLVFRGMNAADQPFYYAALKNNLYDLAKADGLNQGLKRKALAAYIKQKVANPSTEMAEKAKLAAQKSVLSQDSELASSISSFGRKHPSLQLLVPFVKVPTNFLTRTLDYTPVGAIKTVVKQIKNGKFDQRAFSEAIAEATTGTAIIYLGAELTNKRLLSGSYPSSDPREVARWKAEGIQPNSIKVGNTWYSLNYIGPVGLLFAAGKDYHDAAARGDNPAMTAISHSVKNLTGQSFLTGLSGFSNAITDPQQNLKNYVNSQAGSVVPGVSNDIANAFDKKQREINTPVDAVKSRIPGARNTLPIKLDSYGNELNQRTDPFNLTFNPARPSNTQLNPVQSEVSRLHNVDPNNNDLQVTPLSVKQVVKVEGNDIKLTDSQQHDLQQQTGQLLQQKWGELMNTSYYQGLNDIDKAAALNKLRKDADAIATRKFMVDNNLAEYAKAPTKAQISLASGGDVVSNVKKSTKASKTPKVKAKTTKVAKAKASRKPSTTGFKTASFAKSPSLPKIKVAKAKKFTAPTQRKLAISKLPVRYRGKAVA